MKVLLGLIPFIIGVLGFLLRVLMGWDVNILVNNGDGFILCSLAFMFDWEKWFWNFFIIFKNLENMKNGHFTPIKLGEDEVFCLTK